jgi:hypothetical protein
VFDGADYELLWPNDLFVAEATAILRQADHRGGDWGPQAELLLTEAFAGPGPVGDFHAARYRAADPFSGDPFSETSPSVDQRDHLEALVRGASRLRSKSAPRPYWPQRRNPQPPRPFELDEVMDRFVRLVDELVDHGYFERFVPKECVDDRDYGPPHPSELLEIWLGAADLWPLAASRQRWTADVFYGLIEFLHDQAARPRDRHWHDFSGCGWHFYKLAPEPGRSLYRWRVNRLLEASVVPYRLADSGEDVGRLVAITDEARAQLTTAMVERADPTTGDRVRHAVAQFRARAGTEHDKRSAIIALAGVLEERKLLLKRELLRKDEDALFQIANQFAIRHQNEQQRADYDPVFLDWVFWWYLATIDLTDRILDRQAGSTR